MPAETVAPLRRAGRGGACDGAARSARFLDCEAREGSRKADAEAFRRIRAARGFLPLEGEGADLPLTIQAAAAEEVARIEAWARGFGLAACGRLVQRFGARRDR